MDFAFTPEQDDLREVVRDFLTQHPVRSREPGSLDTGVWRRMAAELGLAGLAVPAEHGGAGGGLIELAVVAQELGRALTAVPLLGTALGGLLLPPGDQAALADGSTVVALHLAPGLTVADGAIDGQADAVIDGDIATLAVVEATGPEGTGLYAVSLAGIDRTASSTVDPSRPVATLSFAGAPATRLAVTPDEARDLLHLALAAESLGVAAASLELTIDYLRTRHQFGAPLASFQALRHRVADLAVTVEAATSTTWYGLRAESAQRPVVAPMAKLVAADAAFAVTAESIQLHGGIGFTWEHDAHRYFKRATLNRLSHGDPLALRRVIAERAGLFAPPAPENAA